MWDDHQCKCQAYWNPRQALIEQSWKIKHQDR
ncbi:MAG: hypothetical protein DWC04_04370 [Candidatus Poseidoniales archaeon]|nr:MAG: hypothetical protein DWC04_04370 [Candidatus Poseidoniales archaeon]